MKKTRTYTERPPGTARTARAAWDFFQRTRASKNRPITELFYSPNYMGAGPHWLCAIGTLPDDTLHWKFSLNDLTFAEPCWKIKDELA